jgi:hypothetical protein
MDEKNTAIEQRLSINEEYYYQLLPLIKSSSKEDYELAFQIIENMNYSENFIYMIFLYKETTKSMKAAWKEVAPKSYMYCEKLKDQYSLNLVGIYNSVKNEINDEDKLFVQNQFSKSLMNTLHNYGYDFIDDLQIKIKW